MPPLHDDRADDPRDTRAFERVDMDLLMELLGARLVVSPGDPVWSDRRFVQWLADEARARAERGHRESDRERRQRGESFRGRVLARALGVERCGAPTYVAAGGEARGRHGEEATPRVVSERSVPVIELGVAAGAGRELWDEPPESWVALPATRNGGEHLALRIVGDSMSPLIHSGDTVLVRLGGTVDVGTAIVARHPEDGYVCKRVERIAGGEIELGSLSSDGGRLRIPRDARYVLGTVVLVWCGGAERGA